MSERLTRKEIKHDIREDSFRQTMATALGYVMDNVKILVGIGLGILLLILAVVGFREWRRNVVVEANEKLGEAIEAYQAPIGEAVAVDGPSYPDEAARRAAAAELFTRVREEHPRSGPAAIAGVYLGHLAFAEGDEARARELWEKALDRLDEDGMVAVSLQRTLLALDREAGQAEAVAARLRADLDGRDPDLPKDLMLYELGVTLEQMGNPSEARDAYQRVADEYPESPFANEARQKVTQLAAA